MQRNLRQKIPLDKSAAVWYTETTETCMIYCLTVAGNNWIQTCQNEDSQSSPDREPNLLPTDGSLFLWIDIYPDGKCQSEDTTQIPKKVEDHVSPSFQINLQETGYILLRYTASHEGECDTGNRPAATGFPVVR